MKIVDIANAKIKFKFIVTSTKSNFFFFYFGDYTDQLFIQKITIETKLIQY